MPFLDTRVLFGDVIDKETEYAGLGGTVGKLSYYGKYEMTVLPNRFVRNIFRNRSSFIIFLDFGKLRKEK